MSDPVSKDTQVPSINPTPQSGLGSALLPQWAVLVLTLLVALSAALAAIPGLPAWVPAVSGIITALGAAFGIVSPGLRKKE